MKFEDWFYQDDAEVVLDTRKSVNEFDDAFCDFHNSMVEYLRLAYEVGYKQGVQDSK